MRNSFHKIRAAFALVALLALLAIPGINVAANVKEVYLGGMPAGFTMGLGGAQVVGVCEILTEDGTACPAKQAGLSVGDIILSYGGIRILSAADIDGALAAKGGVCAEITLRRGDEEQKKQISPVKDAVCGKFKLGILIRDSVSGIGTVTYIEKDTLRFGSLGHAVSDEHGEPMSLYKGAIYGCSIVNVVRGERGKAGELKGLFLNDTDIATADVNCTSGIYGNFSKNYDFSGLRTVPISSDAVPGKATVLSTVDGVHPKEYTVSIVKVDRSNKQNKNFVIKITDRELLEATGGIVQGMSGSPIVQNGALIGAITHV